MTSRLISHDQLYLQPLILIRQGLVYHNGILYESDGIHGKSKVKKMDATTGKVQFVEKLEKIYFGEGCDIIHELNILMVLTWKKKKVMIFDILSDGDGLQLLDTISLKGTTTGF